MTTDVLPLKQSEKQKPMPSLLRVLTLASMVGVVAGLAMMLAYAGTDIDQGNIQRIFYIHMPSFFGGFVGFGAATLGGILYLRTRNPRWDTLALAGVEVGMALALVNLVTGMIWARPIWNTWWNWDPRLTAEAIMLLTYAAYLMLRVGIDNVEQRRRFASVYAIFAITTVILTLIIPRIVPSSIHPIVIGPVFNGTELFAEGDFELAATQGVGMTLTVQFIIWAVLLPVTMLWHRIRLEARAEAVQTLRLRVLEQEN
jgi:heme exporter protein C